MELADADDIGNITARLALEGKSAENRLAAAAKSDSITRIITAEELTSGVARPKSTGNLTWKFKASKVRDAAWAASPEYQWDVSAWKGIIANAYYRPPAKAVGP